MKRIWAFLYDLLLSVGILFVATFVAVLVAGKAFGQHDSYLWVYLWAIMGCYYTYSWHKTGQTVGLLAWKLKIVDQNGKTLSYKKAWIRYALATFSLLFFGIGFLYAFLDPQKRYFHDVILKCAVSRA